jgi:small nuclear ribonucleoprotein (snRNP)-like protein
MPIKPEKLLATSLGKKVQVVLRSGKEYTGILRGFDEFMNITLEDVQGTGEENLNSTLVIKGYDLTLLSPL